MFQPQSSTVTRLPVSVLTPTQPIAVKTPSDPSGWTVLIIDNEPDNVAIAESVLEFYGATVYSANGGEEGLQRLLTLVPSVILLDLSMPNLDGWEVLSAIRHRLDKPYIPVIAFTAHAMQGDRERIAAAGFDGYIVKPFELNGLVATIRTVIEQVKSKQPAEAVPATIDLQGDEAAKINPASPELASH